MNRIFSSVIAAIAAFILYLALSAGSATETDSILIWSSPEIILGIILSLFTGILCSKLWSDNKYWKMVNPFRWILLIIYIIPFLIELTIANLTVAAKIITGRGIKPGIVKLTPPMKNNFSTLILSASITYQPGTATVEANDVNRELYIHMLDVGKDPQKVISPDKIFCKINLTKWIRRIAE
ncbi:MAG: Na+/H+ antiporter subunit E [Methanocorpusculum sp.]|nr:Na+/H+ antiporter subunit E [Methanocorpusculum sp.]